MGLIELFGRKTKKACALLVIAAMTGTMLSGCTVTVEDSASQKTEEAPAQEGNSEEEKSTQAQEPEDTVSVDQDILYSERPSILSEYMNLQYEEVKPSLKPYTVEPDLSNVINVDQFYLQDDALEKLAKNMFVVTDWTSDEFFDIYEPNRYDYIPNFITVDSMLHTYHLYFSYLLKRTELNELCAAVRSLSSEMLKESEEQLKVLKGSEWEQAVKTNMAFFAVANCLFDENAQIPAEVESVVREELENIQGAEGIARSPIFDANEDYTQYKPRGYYDTDEELKKYFKAMMWYGRMGFLQKSEDLDRSALLISLLLKDDRLKDWERVYTVTAFFAGTSDDSGYYEYMPVIEAVYGKDPELSSLIGDEESFKEYHRLTGELPKPKINSVPVFRSDSDETVEELNTGFRFMGQRFTIDASIFGKLIYRAVEENSLGELRLLPDALDIPAALGSETAEEILREQGEMDYKGYEENLESLKEEIAAADESTWNASLYSGWLNTIRPLLESKGEGYPSFMQSKEWDKKNLSGFLGSYTELKHDTILYAKQIMAEMGDGGEEPEVRDDRGYVEPEPELFARLSGLIRATREGLDSYGLLDKDSISDLKRLEELSDKLLVMSQKELRDELLSDEEYELIRDYGGQIEHFWQVAKKDEAENEYFSSYEFPAALIADIATDPNGRYLEVANGNPVYIYVIIEVDGKLKIAEGAVSNFYEFPFTERLTDSEWKKIVGAEWDETGEYYEKYHDQINRPEWTDSFSSKYVYEY